MKIIIGKWHVKHECIDDFITLSKQATDISRKEAGNISFTFSEIKTDVNMFLFFEEWKGQQAIDFHVSQDYFKEFMLKSERMLLSKPAITIYDIESQTTL
ncbi:putative quinol monooxygenase [Flavivirga eckloniae]|uniref:Antibiotic biosynthesis monooxygenase n=1 Tax=Flavivirga eckloniae TaxID=1803846 RepID=A0A2K9PRU1_9FLAO|nr:putative quinol monooxygenase [Flavivirga eckloniae]AUP79782.1 antibiotic biosynthesis monooxygenase [Flavivirga eckloniae]